jgi:D-alanyl-D-alanine carboxypeptidase/D-alanyl-D-alanine-endopeptidase (penicillin-binding protein 4)
MKQVNYWPNYLTVLTVAAIATATPTRAQEINPITATNYPIGVQSIPIPVPPPANPYPNNYPNGSPGLEPTLNPSFSPSPRLNNRSCTAFLDRGIKSVLNKYGGKWGILVQTLNDGQTIYEYNPDLYMIPASNVKIFTTVAALQKYDPQDSIRSHSLKDWITFMNLRSNNYYAETLLKFVGGPWAAKQALTRLGVNPNGYRLADGSGLSRQNQATPRALVETLRVMSFAEDKEVFFASLPVAGVSGTLSKRLRQTAAQGQVFAKTGTLRGVKALSGYMNQPQYGMLVFSILVNQPKQSTAALANAIDQVVLQIDQANNCL